jgi:hypothetical protein
MTAFLMVVLGLVLWLLASGIEGERQDAGLAPVSSQPGTGAVLVIGGPASGLEVVRILRARGDEVGVRVRPPTRASGLAPASPGRCHEFAGLAAALASGPVPRGGVDFGALRGFVRGRFAGNRNAVDAAKAVGVRRFVLVSVIGAGESLDAAPWIARRILKNVIVEKTRAEEYLKASGLDYTIIRPGGLLDKEGQGRAYLTPDTRSMSWIVGPTGSPGGAGSGRSGRQRQGLSRLRSGAHAVLGNSAELRFATRVASGGTPAVDSKPGSSVRDRRRQSIAVRGESSCDGYSRASPARCCSRLRQCMRMPASPSLA